MSICIEYEKVTLAREYNRFTQKELIEKLKQFGVILSQGELSKIELGQRKEISEWLLQSFSLALDFPINFFTTPTHKENIKGGLYRKKQSLKKKDQDYIEASTNIFKDTYFCLLNFVEIIKTDIPYYSTVSDSPKEIAQKLREYWGVTGVLDNLVDLLENNGIVVSYIDINDDKFDGFSCFLNKGYFVFINSRLSGDRQRFTIAHELGHIIMQHDNSLNPKSDDEANQFASEFLIPEKEAYQDLLNMTCEKAYYLKSKWKVSMAALIKKAADSSAITPSRYKSLMVQMSKLGYRKHEPNPIAKEKPTLFKEIIDVYMTKRNLKNLEEVANAANIGVDVLKNFFYTPYITQTIRLV